MKRIFILIIPTMLFLLPWRASAARLILESLPNGQNLEVRVSVDTAGESINAWSGEISFPENLLDVRGISDGNSVVNFWIQKPNRDGNEIKFAGLTPGGFKGAKGLLFEIVFSSIASGTAQIYAQNLQFLKSDGTGTPAEVSSEVLNLDAEFSSLNPVPSSADLVPPEEFEPTVSQSPYLFGGKYFLAFATQDKGSGVSSYYVAEPLWRWGKLDWKPAESPYVLQDQGLESYIFVKAVDYAGNERLEMISPMHRSAGWIWAFWTILILGLAAAFIGWIRRPRWRNA